MTIPEDMRAFMQAAKQTTDAINAGQIELYENLVCEEGAELLEAISIEPPENVLKEAADLIVVTLGLIYSHGVDPQKVWDLVHSNNMWKVTGKVVKNAEGKVLKSPHSKASKAHMMAELKALLDES